MKKLSIKYFNCYYNHNLFYSTKKKLQHDFGKVFVLNKITRYEFEKRQHPNLSDHELRQELLKRGSNFDHLVEHHSKHYRSLEKILKSLDENRIQYRVAQRYTYKNEDMEWANCVLTAGGDGTFLLGAGKVNNNKKPIIGINTDVTGSEGYLLLPKHQSVNFDRTLKKLLAGDFKWLMRTRIRIYLEGDCLNLNPIELHDQALNYLEHRYIEHIEENRNIKISKSKNNNANESSKKLMTYLVPTLSLNEVFIGESLSARVSYYQMSVDDGRFFKQKSSGIIVCTGTGSTSWYYNINKMSIQSIKKIIKLIKNEIENDDDHKNASLIPYDDSFIHTIENKFNDSILFEPDRSLMAYTIRDPIINRIYTNETNRGFAHKLVFHSRCYDAVLVIDGTYSYEFNDGAKAILISKPQDSLRTVVVRDDD